MFEKFSNLDVDSAGQGGEYTVQVRFFFTIFFFFLKKKKLAIFPTKNFFFYLYFLDWFWMD